MLDIVYNDPRRAPQEPANGHSGPDRHLVVTLYPIPAMGDPRRMTLDQLYDASQELADWCCRGHRANADAIDNLCAGCAHVAPVLDAYDAVCREMERRPEHRRAVARLVRQMRARR